VSPTNRSEDGRLVKTVVHKFSMGDVDDPDMYASLPIYDWQQTEAGKYCMKNSVEQLHYTIGPDMNNHWGFQVQVFGVFTEKDYMFFKLKFQ